MATFENKKAAYSIYNLYYNGTSPEKLTNAFGAVIFIYAVTILSAL